MGELIPSRDQRVTPLYIDCKTVRAAPPPIRNFMCKYSTPIGSLIPRLETVFEEDSSMVMTSRNFAGNWVLARGRSILNTKCKQRFAKATLPTQAELLYAAIRTRQSPKDDSYP